MKTLAECLAESRRRWSDLITQNDDTLDRFDDLALRSLPLINRSRSTFLPRYTPDSAYTPSLDWDYGLPPDLIAEWVEHGQRWERFLERNPRARLCDMLSDISETHDASSWPYAWSGRIYDWLRSGFVGERPFHDALGIDRPEWRSALAEASQRAGAEGWVFYVEEMEGDRYRWLVDGRSVKARS